MRIAVEGCAHGELEKISGSQIAVKTISGFATEKEIAMIMK